MFGFNVLVTFDNVHYKTPGASAPVPTSAQERLVGLTCEECGKWCKSKAGLVAHHQVHDNDSVGTNMVAQLACADCSRLFPTKIGLSQHRRHAHPTQNNADKLSRVKHSGARWSQQESQSLLRLANNLYPSCETQTALFARLEQYFPGRSAISSKTRTFPHTWKTVSRRRRQLAHRMPVNRKQIRRANYAAIQTPYHQRRKYAASAVLDGKSWWLLGVIACTTALTVAVYESWSLRLFLIDGLYFRTECFLGYLSAVSSSDATCSGRELEALDMVTVARQSYIGETVVNRRVWCIFYSSNCYQGRQCTPFEARATGQTGKPCGYAFEIEAFVEDNTSRVGLDALAVSQLTYNTLMPHRPSRANTSPVAFLAAYSGVCLRKTHILQMAIGTPMDPETKEEFQKRLLESLLDRPVCNNHGLFVIFTRLSKRRMCYSFPIFYSKFMFVFAYVVLFNNQAVLAMKHEKLSSSLLKPVSTNDIIVCLHRQESFKHRPATFVSQRST
ncbi:endonuclease-reverse transcriptase [Clonorchis sinensis]|uniref:Endonuclease-reverse transcriptase n=1 Tax=Clonorchis sinensis TaxID=79923 RepID=G7YFV2_CLOSI|nr:endonuclease-reverse transcriptase [Clonorchis sinensis]